MNKKLVVLTLTIILFGSLVYAQNNSAAAYIRMGVGARVQAMGSAGTATANNVSAAYWNPAGLSRMKRFEVSTMYTDFSDDWGREYLYAAMGTKFKMGSVALSWIRAGVDDIDGYDASGNPTGSFAYEDNNFSLSFSTAPKRIKFGFTGKLYMSDADGDEQTGFGFDAGMLWDINSYMNVGFMVRDVYGKYTEDDDVPMQFNLGAAIYPYHGVTVATDFRQEQDSEDTTISIGAEYWAGIGRDTEVKSNLSSLYAEEDTKWQDIFSQIEGGIRAGLNDGAFTAGLGLRFRNFETNYAYKEGTEGLSSTHNISLILRF